jgi:hypothetical protein
LFTNTPAEKKFSENEQYRIRKLSIIQENASGAVTPGLYAVYYEADPGDNGAVEVGQNISLNIAVNMHRSETFSIYHEEPYVFTPKLETGWKYTNASVNDYSQLTNDNQALRLCNYGCLVFLSGPGIPIGDNLVVGQLFVSAEIEFRTLSEVPTISRPFYNLNMSPFTLTPPTSDDPSDFAVNLLQYDTNSGGNYGSYHRAGVYSNTDDYRCLTLPPGHYYADIRVMVDKTITETCSSGTSGSTGGLQIGNGIWVEIQTDPSQYPWVKSYAVTKNTKRICPVAVSYPSVPANTNMWYMFDQSFLGDVSPDSRVTEESASCLLSCVAPFSVMLPSLTNISSSQPTCSVTFLLHFMCNNTFGTSYAVNGVKINIQRCMEVSSGSDPFCLPSAPETPLLGKRSEDDLTTLRKQVDELSKMIKNRIVIVQENDDEKKDLKAEALVTKRK